MATTNGNSAATKELVNSWAKAQAEVEKARKALETAQKNASKFAQQMYEVLGSRPFEVKSLGGRGYRCIHKPAGEHPKTKKPYPEVFMVIPLPENTVENTF